jgi:hypothetical protein
MEDFILFSEFFRLKGKIYPQLRVKMSFLKKLGKQLLGKKNVSATLGKRVILNNFFNGETDDTTISLEHFLKKNVL